MNNTWLNNNCIGSTHNDASKSTPIFILNTEQHSRNFTIATSNILEQHSSDYTNILRHNINKLINEETEHTIIPVEWDRIHTYIYNSNVSGEIIFKIRAKDFDFSHLNKT